MNKIQINNSKKAPSLGAIYTPPDFADFLTSWAIRTPDQNVLDVGVGEGVFVFSAYRRLLELGAKATDAQEQVHGAEIDRSTYSAFLRLAQESGSHFPHVYRENFFDVQFPPVDAVVGNPPYVRRTYIDKVDQIRQRVLESNSAVDESDIPRLSDLYIYFLLQALSSLKLGGRMAVITADPWMSTGYGAGFRRYLQHHFRVDQLISIDRRVFEDAQVKPVLLLATKQTPENSSELTSFVRVQNGLPLTKVRELLDSDALDIPDLIVHKVGATELKRAHPWSVHFKAPEIYAELASHPLMTQLSNLAETRIGVQTLAKDFFVLTPERARHFQIESQFLEPLAQSSKYVTGPTLDVGPEPDFYVFYCSNEKAEIDGTYCLQYILQGESANVDVRGKNTTVVGYQNKERIERSGRKYWYDLKTSLERRGRAEILIPRLMYRTATVVWNRANYVPGELFIECSPFPLLGVDVEVYLAVLSSSCIELLFRAHAQVYGGGTFNLNPGEAKKVPVLNVSQLTEQQKGEFKQAYSEYLADEAHSRAPIDTVMHGILGIDTVMRLQIASTLADLVSLAVTSKRASSTYP